MAVTTQLNTGTTPLTVAEGGSGVATHTTAYAPLAAGTTATGATQVCSTGLSTSGFVLTSTGASSLPSFQAPTGPTGSPILVSVPLTLAQFLALKNTPFQIIAAQGAHTLIVPISIVVELVMAGVAFSNLGITGLQYGSTTNFAGQRIAEIPAANIQTVTVDTILNVPIQYSASTLYPTMVVYTGSTSINTAVYMSSTSTTPLGGTGATVNVNVVYSVITTSA
jgi:hypothetical protein